MLTYELSITFGPPPSSLDTEGIAITRVLRSIGYPNVTNVRMLRYLAITFECPESEMITKAEQILDTLEPVCDYSPHIHNLSYEIRDMMNARDVLKGSRKVATASFTRLA